MTVKLFYFHDPMCSWCWGFAPTWQRLQERLSNELAYSLEIDYVLGGLAPDTDQPMPIEMQQTLQGYWRRIESLLGTRFNHDFWRDCHPRRATYPACRAVIAAKLQGHEKSMIRAIQEAYYLRAMNPSDTSTLEQLARELELNTEQFAQDLRSIETEQLLRQQIEQYRKLSANGFPSLVLALDSELTPIAVDYQRDEAMFAMIKDTLKTKFKKIMAKTENKTKPTGKSVTEFLNQVEHDQKRADSFAILEMMKTQTGLEPKMWGDSMIGFGEYHYQYASGHEGDTFLVGFSPRKQNLTLYVMAGINQHPELFERLGKHKTSKACLYINKLADVDTEVLQEIIKKSAEYSARHQSTC